MAKLVPFPFIPCSYARPLLFDSSQHEVNPLPPLFLHVMIHLPFHPYFCNVTPSRQPVVAGVTGEEGEETKRRRQDGRRGRGKRWDTREPSQQNSLGFSETSCFSC